jgi:cytochrome b6-f complex subunit 7
VKKLLVKFLSAFKALAICLLLNRKIKEYFWCAVPQIEFWGTFTLKLSNLMRSPNGDITHMNPEIFNAAFLSFTLILVGIGGGFLLLKLQGGEE